MVGEGVSGLTKLRVDVNEGGGDGSAVFGESVTGFDVSASLLQADRLNPSSPMEVIIIQDDRAF